ncbi:MAG: hypothetical protein CMD82_04895 [Gammaproteobacteria bacterium]|nr:hypothetical protein [Gammaproteobacteria bacterium]
MRSVLIIMLSLVLGASTSESSQPSTKKFLEEIDSKKYDTYVYGLESGLDWANELLFREHGIEIFCKPNDLEISATLLKKFLKEEITKNQSFYRKYENEPLVGLAFRNAYIERFPCEK